MMELNAARRLVESMPIVMDRNYSQSEFNRDVKDITKKLQKVKPTSLGSRDNLSLYHLVFKPPDNHYFYLKDADKIVGMLNVQKNEAHAIFLEEAYRGKKLGLVLYLAAIRTLGSLRSSSTIGIDAVRTWRSVAKYYPVVLIRKLDKVNVDFEWGSKGIPLIEGKPITKLPDYFYFQTGLQNEQ